MTSRPRSSTRCTRPGTNARVPLVTVTGTNGKTTTVRMVAHLLGQDGRRVGMCTTEGVYLGDDLVYKADASGPRSAQMVLGNRAVEAAVLETARGGIVRRGLGYDRADVAIITNITDDHLGVDDIDDVDDLVEIKALVAEEIRVGGHVVLNADDPRVAEFAERRAVLKRRPVIRYFAQSGDNPIVERHLRADGVAYFTEDGWLVEAEGRRKQRAAPGHRRGRVVRRQGRLHDRQRAGRRRGRAGARHAGEPGRERPADLRTAPVQPRPRLLLPDREHPGHRGLRAQPRGPGGRRRAAAARVGARGRRGGHAARRPVRRPRDGHGARGRPGASTAWSSTRTRTCAAGGPAR